MNNNEKYKNKYRIGSTRLQNWDYGSNAAYFITICTQNRKCFFGEIPNEVMKLSVIGHIANSCWYEIPNHFPFVELGEHIIMPNHVHGIIIINKPDIDVETQNFTSLPYKQNFASLPYKQNFASLPYKQNFASLPYKQKNKFGPQSKNLASIVRGFKTGTTTNARVVNPDFAWQSRYWEHIIRNENEYNRIAQYIIDNPQKWAMDKLNGGSGNQVMESMAEYNHEVWMI